MRIDALVSNYGQLSLRKVFEAAKGCSLSHIAFQSVFFIISHHIA